jgi:hypothetical protein
VGGQKVDEAHRTVPQAAAVFANKGVKDQTLGGRLPHPLGVFFGLREEGRMARRGRRTRAYAGKGGHGRAYISDDVVVADLIADREVRSVIGKEHHLLGLNGLVQPRHGGQHSVHIFDAVVPAHAELGSTGAAQGVVTERVYLRGRCLCILLIRVRATSRARQVVTKSLHGLLLELNEKATTKGRNKVSV